MDLSTPGRADFQTLQPLMRENLLIMEGLHFLSLLTYIKTSSPTGNVEALRGSLVQALQHFSKTVHSHYPNKITLAAQYCLCAALDESIMCTDWGKEAKWASGTLLEIFYHETFGGERFYTVLDTMLKTPEEAWDLLELQYFLLALGFKGVYFDKDPLILDAIRQNVFKALSFRLERDFSNVFLPTPEFLPKAQLKISSLAVLGISIFLLFISVNAFYGYKVDHQLTPLLERLKVSFVE
jgi:type IV/VI secretion system ImpK/VasF family protein